MKEHLTLFAKTAALCAVLGYGMYVALEAAATSLPPRLVGLWLGLALSGGLALVTVPASFDAWRSGVLPARSGRIERSKEPVWYWSLLALQGGASAGLIVLAGWCIMHLIGGE